MSDSFNKRYFYPLLGGLLLAMLIPLSYGISHHMDHAPALTAEARAKPVILVTNYPLQYLTERVAGDSAQIEQITAAALHDPQLTPRLKAANLIISTNLTVDSWLDNLDIASAKIITAVAPTPLSDESDLAPPRLILASHRIDAQEFLKQANFGWLDPMLMLNEAAVVFRALTTLQPSYRAYYHSRFVALQTDLLSLHEEFKRTTSALDKKPLLAAQSYYDNFARRYRLQITSMNWDLDKMPTDKQWAQLAQMLKTHKTSWMLWGATPPYAVSERLHDLGIKVLVFDPCTSSSPSDDYWTNMVQTAQRFQLMNDATDLKEEID